MGFDPFLVELEAGGHREEVAVLRGTLVEADGRREDVGFDLFFYSFLVDCECGLVGFDLDRLGFFGGGATRHFD